MLSTQNEPWHRSVLDEGPCKAVQATAQRSRSAFPGQLATHQGVRSRAPWVLQAGVAVRCPIIAAQVPGHLAGTGRNPQFPPNGSEKSTRF